MAKAAVKTLLATMSTALVTMGAMAVENLATESTEERVHLE